MLRAAHGLIYFFTRQKPSHTLAILVLSCAIIAATNHLLRSNSTTIPAYTDPVLQQAPKPIQGASAAADQTILSLFQPTPAELAGRSREDVLRERYRNLYTGIYLLKSCDTNVTEYHEALSRKFNVDWASLRRDDETNVTIYRTLQSIIEEARASYTMLYQNTPCYNRNLVAFEVYFSNLP